MTMTAIDLAKVPLAEGRPVWLHAFPVGRYTYPVHGILPVTRERLRRIADSVNQGVPGVSLAVDWEHRQDAAEAGKAAGWIERVEVRSDGLWIAVAFTDEACAKVGSGAWRYLLSEFGDWRDPRTGLRHPDVLVGAAVTTPPFLHDLTAVAASNHRVILAPASGITMLGMSLGGSGRGGSGVPAAPAGSAPTQLTELELVTRFMAVLGCHLAAATFDEAVERALLEDPRGYAAYRRLTLWGA
jgi:hypothetical protein